MAALVVIASFLAAAAVITGSRFAAAGALAAIAGIAWSLFRNRLKPTHHGDEPAASEVGGEPALVVPQRPPVRVPSTVEPTPLLKSLLASAESHGFDAVAAHLWLIDEPSDTLRVVASCGTMRPPERPVPLDDGVLGRAAHGTAALGETARVRTLHGDSLVWRFSVPLERSGTVAGVCAIDVICDRTPDAEVLQELLTPYLPNLAAALAVTVARQQAADAETVLAVARDMSRLLDRDSVISTALERAMALAGASTGSVMLYDESDGLLKIVRSVGLPPSAIDTALRPGEGIAGWVFSTRQPLLIEDLPDRPRRAMRHGVRSAVSVPIADEEDVLGVLNVGASSFLARFTKSHLDTLELIGRQTAIALRNAEATQKVRELFFDSLQALVSALETKDPHAQGGTERVLEYAVAIATELGIAGDDLDALRIAALLHDLGMVASGADLRAANRTLTTVERALLKAHPRIAAEILAGLPAMSAAVPIVYHHHERYDGSGYLDGLAGEDIPLGARILAVADAFVAMTSDRPYRPAMTAEQALAEIRDKAGTQFDPQAVEALRRYVSQKGGRAPQRGTRQE